MWVVFKSFLIFSLLKIFFCHPFFVDASEEINYIGCSPPPYFVSSDFLFVFNLAFDIKGFSPVFGDPSSS